MPSADALRAGKATIELSLLEKQLNQQLKQVRGQIEKAFKGLSPAKIGTLPAGMASRINDMIAKGGTMNRVWGRVKATFSSMLAPVRRLQAAISRLSSIRFDNALSLRSLFAGAGIAAAVAFPVKLAANMELATEQMAVFAGSTDKARAMLMELMEFSAIASQSPEELATQLRLLMTRGIAPDQAVKDIEALAVLAAGSRDEFEQLTKAFADVASATRLNGEEMRQFKNTAFNPLAEIARRTGESMDDVKKRMEAGGVSFNEVAAALHSVVRVGGRFHGMLDRISETLLGKVARAFAALKLAILPVGEAMLAPFKAILDMIIRAGPGLKVLLETNKAFFVNLAMGLVKISALATVFIAIGVAGTVLSVVVSGLVTAFAALIGIIAFLLTPIGWLVIALGVVLYRVLIASGLLREFAKGVAAWFGKMGRVIAMTFQGVMDALSVKNFRGAMTILQQGLQVLWLQIATGAKIAWINIKDAFIQAIVAMILKAQQLLSAFLDWFKDAFPRLSWVLPIDPLKKQVDKLGPIMKAVADMRSATTAAEITAAKNALAEAEKKLQTLVDDAAEDAKQHADRKEWFGDKNPFAFGGKAAAAAGGGGEAIATFDTRLARQIFGKAPTDEELKVLKKIEKNTKGRFGLPVV